MKVQQSMRVLLALAALGITFCSCRSGAQAPRAASTSAPADVLNYNPLQGDSLPIESIVAVSKEQDVLLQSAVDVVAGSCMSARGFDYIQHPSGADPDLFAVRFRYGVLPYDQAEQFGYKNATAHDLQGFNAAVAAVDQRREQFGPAYNAALYDGPESFGTGEPVNSTGCYPLAQKQVYGTAGGLSSIAGFTDILELQVDSNDEMYASDEAQQRCVTGARA